LRLGTALVEPNAPDDESDQDESYAGNEPAACVARGDSAIALHGGACACVRGNRLGLVAKAAPRKRLAQWRGAGGARSMDLPMFAGRRHSQRIIKAGAGEDRL
jgi:hypothetical protein